MKAWVVVLEETTHMRTSTEEGGQSWSKVWDRTSQILDTKERLENRVSVQGMTDEKLIRKLKIPCRLRTTLRF